MDPPRRGELCRSVFPPKDSQQALLAAIVRLVFLDAAVAQERPGCRQLRLGTEGASSKTRSPLSSRQHPQKCQKQALRGCVKQCSAEVAQRSLKSPEDNLGGRAMQVRVLWTQAGLCTKDFRRKCTEAGVAAKFAVPRNAVWLGEARTYLHQTWTEESLDCGSHLDRVAGFKGPRSLC
ncbi:hypothetical protein NDU88_002948 [Pleurodeles waltl]|uniref:Uncharacterized protein n=1 Tax=Pleurodeles waltl TaxID=8319 RepID=A0AAV7LH31_PLEWA|nr:hypothetical protein NDU88_002948 [Pleurodeles waltl]